jgi:hypothetical protein
MADITVQVNDVGLFLGEANPPTGDGPVTPALPVANLDLASIKSLVDKLKEIVELREGVRGSKFDQNITWRSLFKSGLTKVTIDGVSYSADTATPLGLITNTDYTTPPNASNVSGSAGLATAVISWDLPNYSNFSYAEVWRSATNSIGTAVLTGTTQSFIYTDAIGATSITYYYWVRFVSQNNIVGPYHAINGVAVTTSTVNSTNIADAAITTAKIGLLAVDNARIADGTIATAKIADAAITTAKIGDASITSAKIGSAAITNAKIADATIEFGKITDSLQSTNFNSGSTGWRIRKDGSTEFNGNMQINNASMSAPTVIAGEIRSSDSKFVISLSNKYISITV